MSMDSLWGQEKQRKHKKYTQKRARSLVLYTKENRMPSVQTKPLDSELQKSLLAHSPSKIKSIVKAWKKAAIANNESYKKLPKKWVFVGDSGTGKTEMGKAIAGECGMPYFMYCGPGIGSSARNGGIENLTKIFAQAALKAPCVIIIDEITCLFRQHHNDRGEFSMAVHLSDLLEHYKESPILFIATTFDPSREPDLIKEMFQNRGIKFSLPDEVQREQLILYHMKHYELPEDVAIAKELAKKTDGSSHRELEDLVQKVAQKRRRFLRRKVNCEITKTDYGEVVEEFKKADEFFKPTNKTWGIPVVVPLATLALLYLGYRYYYNQAPVEVAAH